MTLDEREQAAPPPSCTGCDSRVIYRGVNSDTSRIEIRVHCIHPMTGGCMHPDCAWFSERRKGDALGAV